MTSVCVGGVSSRPKTGVPARIYLDTNVMASMIPPALAWLVPFLPYLPPIFLDVSTFCTGEPPSAPNLVEATMAAVLAGGEFGAGVVAAELIQQVILSQAWYGLCECSSGTQPAAPAGQAEPTGLVKINPPTVATPPAVLPCKTLQIPNLVVTSGQDFFRGSIDYTGLDVTGFRITPLTSVASAPGPNVTFRLLSQYQAGSTVTTLHSDDFTWNHAFTQSFNYPSWPGANNLEVEIIAATAGGSTNTSVLLEAFCGAAPGSKQQPCCPPDPVMTGMIAQILNYVTLIQRQAVPFGYVGSTAHAGLSGAGALSISGLLGVKVAVTTLPTSYGVAGTSPPEHFDLGFVTFGTPDGFPSAFRLTRNPQVMMPARASVYTDLDYDLAPGVVVTITELRREP